MKTAACRALRRTLASDRPAFGLWVTLESPAITEMAVALGLDWVVIDAEHGHLDWKEIAEHVRTLLTPENLTQIEKVLRADPRLVAYARALAKNAGPR